MPVPVTNATVTTAATAVQEAALAGEAWQAADVAEAHVVVTHADAPSRPACVMSLGAKLAPPTVSTAPPDAAPLVAARLETTGAERAMDRDDPIDENKRPWQPSKVNPETCVDTSDATVTPSNFWADVAWSPTAQAADVAEAHVAVTQLPADTAAVAVAS